MPSSAATRWRCSRRSSSALPEPESPGPLARLRARDPGNLAFARGLRATLVAPALFAIALEGFDNPAFATMAVFGAVAALVFADFGGPVAGRLRAYAATAVAGALLLAAGTFASGSTVWSVVLSMVFVTAIRFGGNIGPRFAAAVSTLILAFMLGDLVPPPGSAGPGRVLGWAGGVAFAAPPAVPVLPAPSSRRLRRLAPPVPPRAAG